MNRVRRVIITLSASMLLTLGCIATAAPAQAQGGVGRAVAQAATSSRAAAAAMAQAADGIAASMAAAAGGIL